MPDHEDDAGYAALPSTLRLRIDDAFDLAIPHPRAPRPPHKRRKLDGDDPQPGGFVVDSLGGSIPDSPSAGGFILDDATQPDCRNASIPLSSIPSALQFLDLQPDDEDVLAVFRNAASGWSHSRDHVTSGDPEELLVSRKDWRAVCAALLDSGAGDSDFDMHDENDAVPDEEEDDSAEEYMQSGGSASDTEDDDGSDDDYQAGGFVRSSKGKSTTQAADEPSRRSRATRPSSVDDDPGTDSGGSSRGEHRLTARQRRECRTTFALFFPGVADVDLGQRRIRIREITQVAGLLKEKISAEETVEMLEAFSTAPDKSMGLADFERMMIAAKLA
ncbi:hypothetical protein C8Q80DRAFT_139941 [Daedaleopsis nitida]|nr:hypothetical protein C8Q80DRAFT_139941 [Daedaleopsis nitida]